MNGDAPGGDVRSVETVWLDVERRMRRGERFRDVEDIINTSDLSAEEKSALWLLGWSYVHPRAQRREANAHLAHLAASTPPGPSYSGRHLRVAEERLPAPPHIPATLASVSDTDAPRIA